MTRTAAAAFNDVSKHYPAGLLRQTRVRAVQGVSFRVEPGEVFGLVGPNRAGKTTLVKMLLSLSRPSAGHVTRLGCPAADRRTLTRVGYVHENPCFPRYLTATALLELCAALSLLPQPEVRRRIPELLELVGLADRSREPIARFSKGMVQRLGLAQALLGDPELLVFDEPGEGVDIPGQQLIRDVIAEQRRQGRATLLVTHQAAEVDRLCNRVGVLVEGRLVFCGPLPALMRDPVDGTLRPLETALREVYERGTP